MPESPNKQLVAASSVAKNSGNQAGGYSQQANFRDIIINSREVRLGRIQSVIGDSLHVDSQDDKKPSESRLWNRYGKTEKILLAISLFIVIAVPAAVVPALTRHSHPGEVSSPSANISEGKSAPSEGSIAPTEIFPSQIQIASPSIQYTSTQPSHVDFASSLLSSPTLPSSTSSSTQSTASHTQTASPSWPTQAISSLTEIATPSSSTPVTPQSTLPLPPQATADGVHLVNSLKTSVEGSGFAWYSSAVDGTNGSQPDDYTTTTKDVYAQWENENRTGHFADTNTFFWVFINSTDAPVNAVAGQASNGYRDFIAYKDDGRLLYKRDGAEFYTIYYCQ